MVSAVRIYSEILEHQKRSLKQKVEIISEDKNWRSYLWHTIAETTWSRFLWHRHGLNVTGNTVRRTAVTVNVVTRHDAFESVQRLQNDYMHEIRGNSRSPHRRRHFAIVVSTFALKQKKPDKKNETLYTRTHNHSVIISFSSPNRVTKSSRQSMTNKSKLLSYLLWRSADSVIDKHGNMTENTKLTFKDRAFGTKTKNNRFGKLVNKQ